MAPKRIKGQFSDHEKELFLSLNKEKVQPGDTISLCLYGRPNIFPAIAHIAGEINLEVIRQLLEKPDVCINCLDDHGMTPLQHAAFKNNKELCEMFLSHGADVNCNEHENGYTTLMFAALSGNTTITRLMLEAGAKTKPINSVGRTASQMAAFVGQHACVSLINNFFSKEELNYYTKIQGFEKEPKLPPALAPSLYKLMLFSNLNPVKLSQYIQNKCELFNEAPSVARVLDCISEKHMKVNDTNDVMAVKTHYLACVVRACHKWDVEKDGINGFIKYILRGRETDGFQLGMEKFIRDSIKEFPFRESQLLQEMVRNIAGTKPGDDPSAVVILTQGINGSRSVDMDTSCTACGETKAKKKCSACKMVIYCSQACQKLHWFTHKKACKNLAEDYIRIQAAQAEIDEREKKEKEEAARQKEEAKETTENTTGDGQVTTETTEESQQNTINDNVAKEVSASDIQIETTEATDGPAVQNGGTST